MYMNLIGNIFRTIENLVSKGDKYYGKLVLFMNLFNIAYVVLFSVFGISLVQNQLMRSLNTTIQMFICILLLTKFHPFREHTLGQSDSKLIFSAAVFLFFNLGIIATLARSSQTITNDIAKSISKLDEQIRKLPITTENEPEPEPYM